MKIRYLYHSGFYVELDKLALLFDYWKGEIPAADKPLYVFASHAHKDHYNPEILRLAARLILSADIAAAAPGALFAAPGQDLLVDGLRIQALESTDAGVAFLIQAGGKLIYHAGDLNCWWWNESPKAENERMKQRYCGQIAKLRGLPIDVGFVPLDPRLEDHFGDGMDIFLRETRVKKAFPMHLWEDYAAIDRYLRIHPDPRIVRIHHPDEDFRI